MRTPHLVMAAAAALAIVSPAFSQDLTVVYRTTGGAAPGTATSYFGADAMRTSDGATDTIIEYGPGRIVSIDHKRKEYSETTFAEIEAQVAQAQQAFQQIPPAMRSMMGDVAGSVTVTKGGVRKVAGYDCQEYTVALGAAMSTTLCASTAVAPPAAKVDYRRYLSLAAMAGPMAGSFGKMMDELKKIQGFPLAESSSMSMMGQSTKTSREATEVKKGPIPAASFAVAQVAPGYKKVVRSTRGR